MTEHVRRGLAVAEEKRPPEYGYPSDDEVFAVWTCQECGSTLELRERSASAAARAELGCDCGAVSLSLRIGHVLDDHDALDTNTDIPHERWENQRGGR